MFPNLSENLQRFRKIAKEDPTVFRLNIDKLMAHSHTFEWVFFLAVFLLFVQPIE